MKNLIKLLNFIKGVIGFAFIVGIFYGLILFIWFLADHSPLTEKGMQWQREHNPEFIKADALERMARAQERNAEQ